MKHLHKLLFFTFFLCTYISLLVPAYAFNGNKTFTHYADNQNIMEVLSDLARLHGLSASFTNGVSGSLSGRFDDIKSRDFLESMRLAFGISYYTQGKTLYFYNESEMKRVFISVKSFDPARILGMLRSSSLLAPELPVKLMQNANTLLVQGPPIYIDQISSAIFAFEEAEANNFVMEVFPLKHAWAQDITLTSMDSQITIPGVASVLRAMVTGGNLSTTVTQLPDNVPGLMGQGLVGNNTSTETAAQVTTYNHTQGVVNIIADPRVNAVIITDSAYRMPYYEQVIADLDKPVELVEIHAAIVDIDSGYNRSLGVSLGGSYDNSTGSSNVTSDSITGGLALSTIYRWGADHFLASIEALEADNHARVLGKPSVLTMDNIQATLENTSTYYVKLEGVEAVDLFKVEAGTVLKVTPHIINNDDNTSSIKLVVHVQDDQDSNTETTDPDSLPPIKQTKINTQAIVREGQSLLIGGYYYEQITESESGVPIIKNIPLLGNLFKTSTKSSKRMERLILITPRIVRENDVYEQPERLNDDRFHRLATQDNYAEHMPSSGAGCARKPSPKE